MTLSEFKAWFEGFTEDMDGAPNEKQWKRIKARVKEINGVAVTERVFVGRYWPSRYRDYISYPHGTLRSAPIQDGPATWRAGDSDVTLCSSRGFSERPPAFDGHSAMMALGRADRTDLAA